MNNLINDLIIKNKKTIFLIVMIIFTITIDQVSKFLAYFFNFNIIFNSGVSLGLLNSLSIAKMLLLTISLLMSMFFLFRKDLTKHFLIFGVFFGGVISNILDRIFYGSVRDWLKIPFFNIYNNLADWFVFLSLLMLIFFLLKADTKLKSRNSLS